MTHTQRTLKYYRDQGLLCEVVERWVPNPKHPGGGFRKDYLGIIDIIGIDGDLTVGIQSCGQDFAAHDKKILASEHTRTWLGGESRSLVLVGWRKVKKKRGGKQMVFRPRVKVYSVEDL